MKTCTYCGKVYPSTATVCELDRQPLEDDAPPAIGPSARKHSTLGVISFLISVVVGCLLLVAFIGAVMLNAGRVELGQNYPGQAMVGAAVIFLMGLDLLALGLGITALCEQGKNRLFGVLGFVFSLGTILGTLGLLLLGFMVIARHVR